MNPLGQIGQQIADDTIEIVRDAAKSAVKATADIASGTAEQITGIPGSKGQQPDDKKPEQGHSATDPNVIAQRRAAERKRLEEVKEQLAQYRRWKQQQEAKVAQEKQAEMQQRQKEEGLRIQKRESWAAKFLKKVGAGAHGETAKQKE